MQDDPINPKHYDGTECAQIGELLTANSFQVLKYNWRLGKKGVVIIDLGKSLWYLERELQLAANFSFGPNPVRLLPPDEWFLERCQRQSLHTKAVVSELVRWNRFGDVRQLHKLQTRLNFVLGIYKEKH